MMTSENSLEQVYVWIWLPGATEPVVAGVLSRDNVDWPLYFQTLFIA